MLGLDNIGKTRCVLIYPINKMYAIPEKLEAPCIAHLGITTSGNKT
jgi:hypothetical protein